MAHADGVPVGTTTLEITAVAVLAGLCGAAAVVAWSKDRVDASTLIRAAGVTAAAGVVGFAALIPTGLVFFGMVHLAYLGLTVTLPMVGLAILARSVRTPRTRPALMVGAVLLVPAVLGFYATHIEPNRLRVQRVTVGVDPARAGHDPVRIAVVSDLQTDHVGPFERKVVARVNALHPDVILVPGDLFQSDQATFEHWLPSYRALLAKLRAPHGVFVVQGDVDGGDRVDQLFATNPDARVLANQVVTVHVGDRTLRIGGTQLAYQSTAALAVKRKLEGPDDGSLRILLSHRPDTVFDLDRSSRVDLTVAGHTHGGQVQLPVIGPLMTMTEVPREVAAGGLHEMGGNRMYVSPGIGMERLQAPQIRFDDPPTIGLIELRDSTPTG
jgi:predicted MPP superfamily phosphohydrolase